MSRRSPRAWTGRAFRFAICGPRLCRVRNVAREQTHLIGFRNFEDGEFVGCLADPIAVRWDGEWLVRK